MGYRHLLKNNVVTASVLCQRSRFASLHCSSTPSRWNKGDQLLRERKDCTKGRGGVGEEGKKGEERRGEGQAQIQL